MTLSTVSLRVFTAGVALVAACGLAACGGTTAGSAAPAPTPATVTVTAPSQAPATSSRPSTSAPDSVSSSARPSRPGSTTTELETADVTVDAGTVDQATAVWLDTACTDLTTLLPVLLAVPTLDQATTPLAEFRTAYRDYYATVADTALQVNGNLVQLDPPAVTDGQALHEGYQYYLKRLADITGSGSIAIDQAADIAGIQAVVEQIQFEVDGLSQEDIGLNSLSGAELQSFMRQIPSCSEFVTS